MRLTLPEPSDLENVGFTSENDIFGYSEFGERLANLVCSTNEPLVITLDAPWGSGKSVFIKQWAGLMREKYGGDVVYFDAFADDFHENAFLSLASQIHSLAKKALNEDDSSLQKFLDVTKKVGKVITPITLGIGLRAVTAGLVSREDVESAIKAFGNESEKVVLEKIQNFDEERASLKAFRESLKNLSKNITKETKGAAHQSPPLIFIVDELDRCRPPFALEIIERIKHLFSVENVCFVLVMDFPQFESAIKGAYGTEFDAHKYLEKFYQLKILLPEPDFGSQNQRNKYLEYLWNNLQTNFGARELNIVVFDEIQHLANTHKLTLRQIEHVMRNIVLVAAFSRGRTSSLLPVTAGLCVMRQINPKLYALARENSLPWEDVKEFLKIDKNNRRSDVINSWRYLARPNVSEEVTNQYSAWWQPYFTHLNLPPHRHLLQHVFTNNIDNLLGNRSNE